MLVSSLPLFWSCAVVWGLLGVVILQRGFWGQLILTCVCGVSTVLSDFAPCPPSLSGTYEVSIMVSLFLQCDGAWKLPLTGLPWLPYNSALVHRVVMVTLHARLLCSRLHYLSRHLPQAHLLLMSLTLFKFWETIHVHSTKVHPIYEVKAPFSVAYVYRVM